MENDDVTHEEVLSLLRPSGPSVDHLVQMLSCIAAQASIEAPAVSPVPAAALVVPTISSPPTLADPDAAPLFLLSSVSDREDEAPGLVIRRLLDQQWYVFGDRTRGRKRLKPDDRLCFYATGVGVVTEATVASTPEKRPIEAIREPDRFPWALRVKDVRYFFDKPTVIDANLRGQLEAFKDRDPNRAWACWPSDACRLRA